MRLGYLGPAGTFSEEAARAALDGGDDAELVGLATVRDTILAVHDGSVDRAIVPIENSLEGPIGVTLDTLADDHDVAVVGELVLAVSQHLIAGSQLALECDRARAVAPAGDLAVRALPARAGAQRRDRARLVDRRGGADRRRARRAVGGDRHAARGRALRRDGARARTSRTSRATRRASSSWRAARRRRSPADGTPAKTSLAFWGSGDDSPGWLVRCLSEFAFRGVNLTKIESRPLRMRLGHYRFFVDCEGSAHEPSVAEAVEGLRKHCEQVRILGSYPAAGAPE